MKVTIYGDEDEEIKDEPQTPYRNNENFGSPGVMILFRKHFIKLLEYPKPLRDQLIFELAILQAFRTGEIVTLKVNDIDFENGIIYVLDSKKHKHFPVPLHPIMAEHLAEYIHVRRLVPDDYVFKKDTRRGRPSKNPKSTPILPQTIHQTWLFYDDKLGLPPITPRKGRGYFAYKWAFIDHKSDFFLQTVMMRHSHAETTNHYKAMLVDWEAVREEFYRGLDSPFISECARSDKCPNSCPNCRCKNFLPQAETDLPVIGECAHRGSCHFSAPRCNCKAFTPAIKTETVPLPRAAPM